MRAAALAEDIRDALRDARLAARGLRETERSRLVRFCGARAAELTAEHLQRARGGACELVALLEEMIGGAP